MYSCGLINLWHFQQTLFKRLYKGVSNSQCGTLLQLRNMLNQRNVSADVSGQFNSTVDFVELVTNCHIVAAAMNFFGMIDVTSNPTNNATLPNGQWVGGRRPSVKLLVKLSTGTP